MFGKKENSMEKIVSLAKRRGFVFPGSEIYGGLANSWDYGPLGVELKNNIKKVWWERFVHRRDDIVGLDAALIMNPKVWEASGHLATFSDPLVECLNCHSRFRVDQIPGMSVVFDPDNPEALGYTVDQKTKCPNCKTPVSGNFTRARQFNLMLKTSLGPVDPYLETLRLGFLLREEEKLNNASAAQEDLQKIVKEIEEIKKKLYSSTVYFRPETAQAMFVDFKQIIDTTRKHVPFGVAQIGKAFRNEITPGNFIFRTREFEQMEIEYFVRESDWEKCFELWREAMWSWITKDLGLDKNHVHELEVPEKERAHYSKRTIDFEYDYPFGKEELYGLAYRSDFDLRNHFKEPPYKDEGGEPFYPHVVEPTWGVDRSVLAVLADAYHEDGDRIVLKLKPRLAPYKAAIFPLLANKPALVEKAREIYASLRAQFIVDWDDRGNVGKRYYSQDEIGTPYTITVDFDTLGEGKDAMLKDTVTVRDRDTAKQERIKVKDLSEFLVNHIYRAS